MRSRFNRQPELDFHPSNLQLTNEYYEKYESRPEMKAKWVAVAHFYEEIGVMVVIDPRG